MPSVQVYHTTWQLKCPLCRCIRPRGNWNSLYVGVSGQVANKMPSVYVFQTTWQLKCPLRKWIRPRGNWNALLCRCIRLRGNWITVCEGVSNHVAIEIPPVQVIRTSGNIFKTLTFTVSTIKLQILWISISYRRRSCNTVNKKIGDGLYSLH